MTHLQQAVCSMSERPPKEYMPAQAYISIAQVSSFLRRQPPVPPARPSLSCAYHQQFAPIPVRSKLDRPYISTAELDDFRTSLLFSLEKTTVVIKNIRLSATMMTMHMSQRQVLFVE